MNVQVVCELRQVGTDIVPAGLFHVVSPVGGVDIDTVVIVTVNGTTLDVAVCIVVNGVEGDLGGHGILGDIQPKSNRFRALDGDRIRTPGQGHGNIAGGVGTRARALRVVNVESQSLIAAVDPTGLTVYDAELALFTVIQLGFMGAQNPVIQIGTGTSFLKVKDHIRTLAELQCCRGRYCRIVLQCHGHGTGGNAGAFCRSCVGQTVH